MTNRTAEAVWTDGIRGGRGKVELGSGAWKGEYSFRSRFMDEDSRSNPEELISAGLASCVSMAVSNQLEQEVAAPDRVQTEVNCRMKLDREMGPTIDHIEVATEVAIHDAEADRVTWITERAQADCPVTRLLSDAEVEFEVEHTN